MVLQQNIEKHSIKISLGVAATVIIFLIVMSANFARWQAEMEATHKEFDDRITHVGEKVVNMRSNIEELKDKASDRDVELAKINTKLSNIETLLIEIRQDLKDHSN